MVNERSLYLKYALTHWSSTRYTAFLAESMFSAKRNWLDAEQLKKGWKSCFSNYGLIVLAFAVDPDKFVEFLTSPVGESFAVGYLNERWQSIVARANTKTRSRPTEREIQRLKEAGKLADQKLKEYESRQGGH